MRIVIEIDGSGVSVDSSGAAAARLAPNATDGVGKPVPPPEVAAAAAATGALSGGPAPAAGRPGAPPLAIPPTAPVRADAQAGGAAPGSPEPIALVATGEEA